MKLGEVLLPKNTTDAVCLGVPLLIRLMEYAKEDAKTDMDLHFAAEQMVALSNGGKTLTMKDYDRIISKGSK